MTLIVATALLYISRSQDGMPDEWFAVPMLCDRMHIEMISENRKEIIERMLTKEQKQFMKQMKKFPSVLRTEYILALLHDKDNEKAEQIKAIFEKCAKSYPYQNDIESERELMDMDKIRKLSTNSKESLEN